MQGCIHEENGDGRSKRMGGYKRGSAHLLVEWKHHETGCVIQKCALQAMGFIQDSRRIRALLQSNHPAVFLILIQRRRVGWEPHREVSFVDAIKCDVRYRSSVYSCPLSVGVRWGVEVGVEPSCGHDKNGPKYSLGRINRQNLSDLQRNRVRALPIAKYTMCEWLSKQMHVKTKNSRVSTPFEQRAWVYCRIVVQQVYETKRSKFLSEESQQRTFTSTVTTSGNARYPPRSKNSLRIHVSHETTAVLRISVR